MEAHNRLFSVSSRGPVPQERCIAAILYSVMINWRWTRTPVNRRMIVRVKLPTKRKRSEIRSDFLKANRSVSPMCSKNELDCSVRSPIHRCARYIKSAKFTRTGWNDREKRLLRSDRTRWIFRRIFLHDIQHYSAKFTTEFTKRFCLWIVNHALNVTCRTIFVPRL